MPSQVVSLSQHLIDAIDQHTSFKQFKAFAPHNLWLRRPSSLGKTHAAFRLYTSLANKNRRNPIDDDGKVYALLLQAPGDTLAPPHVLADAVELLRMTEAAILALPDLSNHDRMEVVAAFAEARAAPPALRQSRRSAPQTPFERDLLARAEKVQTALSPAFAELDHELARYQEHLAQTRLGSAVTRLDLQSELGTRLRVEKSGDADGVSNIPVLNGPTRRGNLQTLIRSVHCQIDILQQIVGAVITSDDDDLPWLVGNQLRSLYYQLEPACDGAGKLRPSTMQIASPVNGRPRDLLQPAVSLEEAVADLCAAFDAALWEGLHPLIRASFLHLELVRLHPYLAGNGRLARLLMLGCLLEADLPPLPLMTVLEWNRDAYLNALDRAIAEDGDLGWLDFCLNSARKAIPLGRHFADTLGPQIRLFAESMQARDNPPDNVTRFSALAATTLLGPDPQLIRAGYSTANCDWHFDRGGLIDRVDALSLQISAYVTEEPSLTLWSHSIARRLLEKPPARL